MTLISIQPYLAIESNRSVWGLQQIWSTTLIFIDDPQQSERTKKSNKSE